jgi:hypothetical protein
LILYPQYPEVRFSGYLLGSGVNASEWMDVRKQGRSKGRFLLIGIRPDGSCLGYLSVPDSRTSKELDALLASDDTILTELPIGIGDDEKSSRFRLLHELRRIHLASPIAGKIFDKATGKAKPYRASNGGGYTLEAELGIPPNGYSEPDFDGWEVKAYSGSVLTLMTPEPNGGVYQSAGVDAFVRTYGYRDKNGKPDRLNFGGIHRIEEKNKLTGLTMKFVGYTAGNAGVEADGGICLVDTRERIAAEWSFAKLLEHWNKKHAKAAYVPYSADSADGSTNYSYADHVSLGEGTSFIRFLQAFASRSAYYDPGIKLVGASGDKPEIKRRSQFRIKLNRLDSLYEKWESVDLL